jgi:hypothetical protein
MEKSIADLSEEKDLKPFVKMLTRFILKVKKKDASSTIQPGINALHFVFIYVKLLSL